MFLNNITQLMSSREHDDVYDNNSRRIKTLPVCCIEKVWGVPPPGDRVRMCLLARIMIRPQTLYLTVIMNRVIIESSILGQL